MKPFSAAGRIALLVSALASTAFSVWLIAQIAVNGSYRAQLQQAAARWAGAARASSQPQSTGRPQGAPARDSRMSDYRYVLRRMQEEGLPHEVARVIVLGALNDSKTMRDLAEASRESRNSKNKAVIEAGHDASFRRTNLRADAWAEIDQGLGYSEPNQKFLREVYGDLPDDKLAAIHLIRMRPAPNSYTQEDQIRALLSPPELLDFERYASRGARGLQGLLQSVDVTEDEYLKLREAYTAQSPTGSTLGGARDDQPKLRGFHAILGDERFLKIAHLFAPRPASIDGVYLAAGKPAADRIALFLQAVAVDGMIDRHQTAFHQRRRAGQPLAKDAPTEIADAYRALTAGAGLTELQIAAFDQTELGGVLKGLLFPK